mmetsp:Transcript_16358/g.46759  ORF Transcript_16358/g.46759 Transcript_16358/m.46759 type:complete len:231 (+) Transcript_16358:518-1210(+)
MCKPVLDPCGPSSTDGQPKPVLFVTMWNASCVRNEGMMTLSNCAGQCFFNSISKPYNKVLGRSGGSATKNCCTYSGIDMFPACTWLAHVLLPSSCRKVRMTAWGQAAANCSGRQPLSAHAPVMTTGFCAENSWRNLATVISDTGTRGTGRTSICRGGANNTASAPTTATPPKTRREVLVFPRLPRLAVACCRASSASSWRLARCCSFFFAMPPTPHRRAGGCNFEATHMA